jgi:GNAT superfamily N-acetyltransferase
LSFLTPTPTQIDEFDHQAKDVIHIRLINNEQDMLPAEDGGAEAFRIKYAHQFFPSETINGYRDLHIDILFTSSALFAYLGVRYTKERPKHKNTALADLESRYLPGFTKDLSEFQRQIHEPFVPPGKRLATYTLEDDDYGVEYEIFGGTFEDEAVRLYHERIQYFLLFYIDRSSYIDDTDPVWETLFIFQKRRIGGMINYRIVGYTTLYKFLFYPDKWRLRLSQILILPPYQRKGHGGHLLRLVFRLANERNYAEVNIEDPSPGFQFLRDLTDLQACTKQKLFEHTCNVKKSKTSSRASSATADDSDEDDKPLRPTKKPKMSTKLGSPAPLAIPPPQVVEIKVEPWGSTPPIPHELSLAMSSFALPSPSFPLLSPFQVPSPSTSPLSSPMSSPLYLVKDEYPFASPQSLALPLASPDVYALPLQAKAAAKITAKSPRPRASPKASAPKCPGCDWNEAYAAEVKTKLKITVTQVRRLFEVRKLSKVNFKNEKEYAKYQLEIKKRLLQTHAEQLCVLTADDAERRRKLNALYKKDEAKFLLLLSKAGTPHYQGSPGPPPASPLPS